MNRRAAPSVNLLRARWQSAAPSARRWPTRRGWNATTRDLLFGEKASYLLVELLSCGCERLANGASAGHDSHRAVELRSVRSLIEATATEPISPAAASIAFSYALLTTRRADSFHLPQPPIGHRFGLGEVSLIKTRAT